MKLQSAVKNGEFVVRLSGEIDHCSALGIREKIDQGLEEHRPRRLIFDLSGTEFMDSSGLGLILGRLRKCGETGCQLTVVNPRPQIMKILRLAGVEKMLDIRTV